MKLKQISIFIEIADYEVILEYSRNVVGNWIMKSPITVAEPNRKSTARH